MEKGIIALPAIVIFASIILVVGLSLLGGGFLENLMSSTSVQSQKSFYLSESGVQDGLIKVTRNKNTSTNWNPLITDANDTLSVTVSGTDTKTITSSSDVGNKMKDLRVTVSVDADGKVTFSNWEDVAE